MSRRNCPLCEAPIGRTLGSHPDFAQTRIVLCDQCGVMMADPMPDASRLNEVYREDYRAQRKEEATSEVLQRHERRAAAQHQFISGALPTSGVNSVLDVGCGSGMLLHAYARSARRLVGFEPDERMGHVARRKLGTLADIRPRVFASGAVDDEVFDLVTASHVVEHVPDIVAFLRLLLERTRPGGAVFIEVPNECERNVREQIEHPVKGLLHVWYLNPGALQRAIVLAGGRVVRLTTFGPSRARFSHVHGLRRDWHHWASRQSRRVVRRITGGRVRVPRQHREAFPPHWMTRENGRRGIWIRAIAVRATEAS